MVILKKENSKAMLKLPINEKSSPFEAAFYLKLEFCYLNNLNPFKDMSGSWVGKFDGDVGSPG